MRRQHHGFQAAPDLFEVEAAQPRPPGIRLPRVLLRASGRLRCAVGRVGGHWRRTGDGHGLIGDETLGDGIGQVGRLHLEPFAGVAVIQRLQLDPPCVDNRRVDGVNRAAGQCQMAFLAVVTQLRGGEVADGALRGIEIRGDQAANPQRWSLCVGRQFGNFQSTELAPAGLGRAQRQARECQAPLIQPGFGLLQNWRRETAPLAVDLAHGEPIQADVVFARPIDQPADLGRIHPAPAAVGLTHSHAADFDMPVGQAVGQLGGIEALQAPPLRLKGRGLQGGQAQQSMGAVVLEAPRPQALALHLVQRQIDLTQFHAIPADIGQGDAGPKLDLHAIEMQLTDRAAPGVLQLGGVQLAQLHLPGRKVDLRRPRGQLTRLALPQVGTAERQGLPTGLTRSPVLAQAHGKLFPAQIPGGTLFGFHFAHGQSVEPHLPDAGVIGHGAGDHGPGPALLRLQTIGAQGGPPGVTQGRIVAITQHQPLGGQTSRRTLRGVDRRGLEAADTDQTGGGGIGQIASGKVGDPAMLAVELFQVDAVELRVAAGQVGDEAVGLEPAELAPGRLHRL